MFANGRSLAPGPIRELKWQKKNGTATPDSIFPLILSSSMHVCKRAVILPLGQSDCSNGKKKMGLPLLIQFGSHEKLKAHQLGLGHLQENIVASLITHVFLITNR
jgi:hypothetical protein